MAAVTATSDNRCPRPDCGEPLGANLSWCFACGWQEGATPISRRREVSAQLPPESTSCQSKDCGGTILANATSCPYCGTPTASSDEGEAFQVVLPWATVQLVEGDRVALGRLPSFSPFASELAPTPRVSRRHAIIHRPQGVPVLVDQESQNGTFCNGVRVTPFAEIALRNGDVVSLAGDVSITIRAGRK